jgi:hypothetical protein
VTPLSFIVIDSSIEPKDLMSMELENQGKMDSFRYQASEAVLKDQSILQKIFPGIKNLDMAQAAKGVRVWGGMAYIGGIDLNAIFFIFLADDNSVQARLLYNSTQLNGPSREEILNSIVDVIKA